MNEDRAAAPIPTPAALRRPSGVAVADPGRFGRVADDGAAYVRVDGEERLVGQWVAGTPAEGLAFYARKFDELETERALVAKRLADGHMSPEQASEAADRMEQALVTPQCIGDIAGLRQRLTELRAAIELASAERAAERAARKAAAAEERASLVAQAEELSDSTAWKSTTEAYTRIVEAWKGLPRTDRALEQELWQRLSAARARFDKRRRAHFAERDAQRKEALEAKRALITRAEQLSTSTDWAGTTRAFKDLLQQWKAAPRGSKADEDKLWKRFKSAQDAFFAARTAADAAKDAELTPNIEPKRALVVEAEQLLPISDTAKTKKALRDIQRRWDAFGDLPAPVRRELEARLAKVEDAVRKSEQQSWQRSNPEALARAESTITAFDTALQKLEAELQRAEERGDTQSATAIVARIEQTRSLKQAAESAASEFRTN